MHRELFERTVWNLSLLAIVLAAVPCGGFSADAPPADQPPRIVLSVIDGPQNGSGELIDNRFKELTVRLGEEPKGHGWWLWGLTAIDYDRDGDPDFVMSIHGSHNGVVMKNLFRETGAPKLVDVTKELGVDGTIPGAAGRKTMPWDFDGDGWLDLPGVGTPHLLNQGGKKFLPIGKGISGGFRPQAIVDLNGDGYLDVFNEHASNYIYDPKAKAFTKESCLDPVEAKFPPTVHEDWTKRRGGDKNRFFGYRYLVDHDLDDDGRKDVVVVGYASYGGDAIGRYFLTDASGNLVDAPAKLGLPTTGAPILVTDLTGDGLPEVLIAADAAGGLFVSRSPGKFSRVEGPLTDMLALRDPYLHIADVVDLDNDADLDLVIAKPRSGPKAVFENQGQGRFALVLKQKGWDADPVAVCDINCDGRIDVAIGGPGNQVTYLINDTPKTGTFCDLSLRMPGPNVNAVGAVVEVYRAGTLKKSGTRPVYTLNAPADGTAVHLGLADAQKVDLRVTFPDGKQVELNEQQAQPRLRLDHDGRIEAIE